MYLQKLFLALCGAIMLHCTSFAQDKTHQDLINLISGCQLVYFTNSSALSSNSHSSITYVNYCPNGTYWVDYDGSFTVHSNSGGSVLGASNGQSKGTWKVVDYQGQPYLQMTAQSGGSEYYPIYKHLILQGSWEDGNTKYVVQRNKADCY